VSASELLRVYQTDTHHQISAERFKGGMVLCDIEQKKVSHDFTTKDGEFPQTHKAGRYWVGIERKEDAEVV
jgi:hypothetical protein